MNEFSYYEVLKPFTYCIISIFANKYKHSYILMGEGMLFFKL